MIQNALNTLVNICTNLRIILEQSTFSRVTPIFWHQNWEETIYQSQVLLGMLIIQGSVLRKNQTLLGFYQTGQNLIIPVWVSCILLNINILSKPIKCSVNTEGIEQPAHLQAAPGLHCVCSVYSTFPLHSRNYIICTIETYFMHFISQILNNLILSGKI